MGDAMNRSKKPNIFGIVCFQTLLIFLVLSISTSRADNHSRETGMSHDSQESAMGHDSHGENMAPKPISGIKNSGGDDGKGDAQKPDEPQKAHKHVHKDMTTANDSEPENLFTTVGLDEKLGEKIPLDLAFLDENGKSVTLGELVDRPVLLQLIFYHCPQACNMMMANLASILKSVTFTPGEDYRIVTVSFDHEDTPKIASDTKSNYMNIVSDDFPKNEWAYLTGKIPEIQALTSSVGFKFKRLEQHNFIHPNVLVVLGEDGRIIRYLYGVEYLPFDVSMAITEATRGTPAISIKKLLTYCFDYDPQGKKYVFKTFRVFGVVLMLVLVIFFFFLIRKNNRKTEN